MKIGICDDEKSIRDYLKGMAEAYNSEFEVALYPSGESLLAEGELPDLIFLDICLASINGMEVAKTIRKTNEETIIIFITGKKQYVFEAFDVEAYHYLLKPVEKAKFMEVLDRAVKECQKRKKKGETTLLIKCRQGSRIIKTNEILYGENDRRRIILHTWKEKITFYSKMEELEKKLGEEFFRCHRGYLVNMDYISTYDRESIQLKNGETIYMSKQKYNAFVEKYHNFLRNGGRCLV